MHVSWLELRNLRCYESLSIEPDEGVNILVGENGMGKTSVLEAIGYMGLTKSFRSVSDDALIRDGSDGAVIRGGVDGGPSEITFECELPSEGRRTVLLNGKRPKRLADVQLSIPVVAFVPDDLDVVKRGPAMRRGYLDDLASQLWPQAGADLSEFERALRQRNALLRQEGRNTDPTSLDVWDERLSEAGARVLMHRRAVATDLQPHLSDAYVVVGGEGDLRWAYRSTWGSDGVLALSDLIDTMRQTLADRRSKDMDVRTTTAGPHRDEPDLELDGRSTRNRASQGEQRTVVLAMRIGAYRLIEDTRNTTPILLLDDVFSELDHDRASRVLSLMPAGQVFVTTAREDEVPIEGRRWSVHKGTVT
ncbi:MAG: DNA replication/repair protein RecF [Acidimicrobiia bacterium]